MTDEPETLREQRERDHELGARLRDQRPVPSAGFRGALARRLAAEDPGYGPRPEGLRLAVAACCSGGSVLILLGALAAVGAL